MRVLLDENLPLMETSNLLTDTECANLMTTDKVHWFLDLFDELGVKIWIDGGWGVDALLGESTRAHHRGQFREFLRYFVAAFL